MIDYNTSLPGYRCLSGTLRHGPKDRMGDPHTRKRKHMKNSERHDDQQSCVEGLMEAAGFALLFGTLPSGAALLDHDLCIARVNAAFLALTGYTAEDLEGAPFLDLADDRDVTDVPETSITIESPFRSDVRLRRKAGPELWTHLSVTRITADSDDTLCYLAVVEDISERKNNECAIQLQRDLGISLGKTNNLEDALEMILETALGFDSVDSGGIYIVNEETNEYELLVHRGLAEEFVRSVSRIAPDDPRAVFMNRGLSQSGNLESITGTNGALERGEGIVSVAVFPVQFQAGTVACLVLSSHTGGHLSSSSATTLESIAGSVGAVIARIRAETAMHESEDRYRLAQRMASVGSWDWDLDRGTLHWSAGTEPITGWDPDEIGETYRGLLSIIHPDDRQRVMDAVDAAIRDSADFSVEHRIIAKDGGVRWLMERGSVFRGEDGRPERMLGLVMDITERREMEENIARAEADWRDSFDALDDILLILDADRTIKRMNNVGLALLGTTEDAVADRKCHEVFAGLDRPSAFCPINEVAGSKAPLSLESPLPVGGRYYNVKISPGMDGNGEIVRHVVLMMDITERKRIELELRESEEKFRKISASAQDAVIMVDNDGRVSFWNSAAQRIFGYSVEEAVGMAVHELIMDENRRERFLKGFTVFRTTGTGPFVGKTVELKARHKNGDDIPIELSVSSVRFNGAWHAIGIMRDISERLKSEAELKLLNTGIDQAYDSVVITDRKGGIQYVNPGFERISGYTRDEAIGHTPRILKSGLHDPLFYKNMWKTIARGDTWKGEVVNRRKNGNLYYEEMTITPVRADSGITHFVAIKRDVSDRHELEVRIERMRREYEAFMRHEIKNLLTPMKGFSDLLLMDDGLDDKHLSFLQKISDSAQRAINLIDSLKKLQDIENGQHKLEMSPYKLDKLIENKLFDLHIMAEENGVSFAVDSTASRTRVAVDFDLMPGVFVNLIKNAIEHVADLEDPSEKTVLIDLSNRNGRLVVAINNRGEPVPQDRLETFFEKFNSTGKRKRGGTGLGTTYAWLVTRAHGGSVSVASDRETGTTVTLELPLMD